MRRLLPLAIATAVLASGCTWVHMAPGASSVRVVAAGAAPAGCEKRGEVVVSVKDRIGGATTREEREAGLSNCREAPVVREYRRPIAYDVDYVYRGSKFRTRLAQDPGNRLRVRVSISEPWIRKSPFSSV